MKTSTAHIIRDTHTMALVPAASAKSHLPRALMSHDAAKLTAYAADLNDLDAMERDITTSDRYQVEEA